jgi:hypothetical protein
MSVLRASAETLERELQGWIAAQQYERPLRWHQVTLVWCELLEPVGPNSTVLHRHGERRSCGLQTEWNCLEYLVFVRELEPFTLEVLGMLGYTEYAELSAEFGFATLADLHRLELPQADELLQVKLSTQPYYTCEESTQYSLETLVEQANTVISRILGLTQANDSELEAVKSDLAALLGNEEQTPVGFALALLVAACSPHFAELLLQRELRLLRYRLETCFVSEQQRHWFCARWFPGLLESVPQLGCRLVGAGEHWEPLEPLPASEAELRRVQRAPFAGLALVGPLQYFPQALERGFPVELGRVSLTHRELELYLCQYLEQSLRQRISMLRARGATLLAVPLWLQLSAPYSSVDVQLVSLRRRVDEQLVLRGLAEQGCMRLLDNAELEQQFILGYVLPIVAELEELRGGEARPSLDGEEVEFDTKRELDEYAEQHWPPCLQRMVQNCVGAAHLKFNARLKLAAVLRSAGYSLEQAEQLWCTLFSETELYAGVLESGADFLDCKQGRVLRHDYQQGKQQNLGISCQSFAQAGLCVFSGSLDIESCQQSCVQAFNSSHASQLRYPIKSPSNYIQLSLRRRKGTQIVKGECE